MWLLNTKTAILQKFGRPEDVPGGYAILSHVWGEDKDEDTFQAVRDAAEDRKDVVMWRAGLEALEPWKAGPHKPEPGPALLRAWWGSGPGS